MSARPTRTACTSVSVVGGTSESRAAILIAEKLAMPASVNVGASLRSQTSPSSSPPAKTTQPAHGAGSLGVMKSGDGTEPAAYDPVSTIGTAFE